MLELFVETVSGMSCIYVLELSPFPSSPSWHYCVACLSFAVLQLLRDTDKALSILRARSLLVRLIQSLPTPAIAAAGGPCGLLNITRLLAAQDLAKGNAPASFGSISCGDRIDTDQSSVAGDQQAEPVVPKRNSKLVPECDNKLVDPPSSDQDSLLKVNIVHSCVEVLWIRLHNDVDEELLPYLANVLHALSRPQPYRSCLVGRAHANLP